MPRTIAYREGGFTNCGIGYTKFSQEELAEMKDRVMTENEAIKILKKDSCYECAQGTDSPVNCEYRECRVAKATRTAIKALEEIQQYRAIGTPEELITAMKYVYLAKKHGTVGQVIENCVKYEEIGTPEECLWNKDFLDFLADKMNPNDFEVYLQIYNTLEENGCEE